MRPRLHLRAAVAVALAAALLSCTNGEDTAKLDALQQQVDRLEAQLADSATDTEQLEAQLDDMAATNSQLQAQLDETGAPGQGGAEPDSEEELAVDPPAATTISFSGRARTTWTYATRYEDLADRHEDCSAFISHYTLSVHDQNGEHLTNVDITSEWLSVDRHQTMVRVQCELDYTATVPTGPDQYQLVLYSPDGDALDRRVLDHDRANGATRINVSHSQLFQ